MDSSNRYIKDEYLGTLATSDLMSITVFSILVRNLDLQMYMSLNTTENWYQSNLKDISYALVDHVRTNGAISERLGLKIIFYRLLKNTKNYDVDKINSKKIEVAFEDLNINIEYLKNNEKLPNFSLFRPETIDFLKSLNF